jgi:hypothetical protein
VCSQQPLYRARRLEPVAGYEDALMIQDQNGPLAKGPFYGITGIEPVTGLGPHGVFFIWSQGAAPAGYAPLPTGVPAGNIGIGAAASFVNPVALQLGPLQLLQMRWHIEPVALVGGVADDVDIAVLQGAIPRFGVPGQAPGAFNMAEQFQDPGDGVSGPAQGANEALPAAFPAVHPRDQANLNELFIFENNGPTFKVINNAVAALSGGAIGLRIWGFRYVLSLLVDDGSWTNRFLAGAWRRAPQVPRIVTVPIATAVGGTAN